MKKQILLIIIITLLKTFTSFAQTKVYEVPMSSFTSGNNCNVLPFSGGGGALGFSWTSTGTFAPSSISVELNYAINCGYTTSNETVRLNSSDPSSQPTPIIVGQDYCTCTPVDGIGLTTWTFDTSDYNVGGLNTISLNAVNGSSGFGAIPGYPGVYARVTVNYAGPDPAIHIKGGTAFIENGDTAPITSDGTEYGSSAGGISLDHTFTIKNEGTNALTLTGTPLVNISGSSAFSIQTQPTSNTVAGLGSETFAVRFNPTCSQTGLQTAIVSIVSDDPDTNPYTFTVQGTVTSDNVKPTAIAKNITVQLDATGSVTVNATELNDGSTDNCGISDYKIASGSAGTVCSVVGENNTLALTAPSGSIFKDVLFASYGTPTGSCGNFALGWCNSPSSVGLVFGSFIGRTSSSIFADNTIFGDPCNGTGKELKVELSYGPAAGTETPSITYSCTDIGSHDVVLYITDNSGNVSTVNATITVEDKILPTIACVVPASSYNNNTGICGYIVPDNGLDPIAEDNCSVTVSNDFNNSSTLNGTIFPIGTTTVIWTVTDASGNDATCTYDIVVVDAEAPTITCAVPAASYNNDLGVCSYTVVDNSLDPVFADTCSAVSVLNNFNNSATLSGAIFPIGTTTVTWTATDAFGNDAACTYDIVVVDAELPIALAKDGFIQLDATGNATITAQDVDNGSSDLCGTVNLSLSPNTFTCADIGDNILTLTVTDQSGNESRVRATVRVEDKMAPIVAVKNITVQLDSAGNATIQASDIDDNSSDNCGIDTRELNITSFTCANIGPNPVQLTVTDSNGNSDTKNAIVTVEDKIAPIISTKNIIVQLNATGNAVIAGIDVNNGSTDVCGGALIFTVSPNTFNCTNVGANAVTLTVTDASGNPASASATVTIVDKTAPIVLTKNITIQFNALGNASITAADVDNGSANVCGGVPSLSVSPASFTCANAGANTVTLTATGANGEISSATAIVTILEKIVPIVKTQDISVELDEAGNASITANQINNGSSDNCGIGTMSLNKTSFDCTNVGVNTVVLTVVDKSGNTASANAKVTVVSTFNDNDNDGILDNCDSDDDNDGILDPTDNCPITSNPYQEDRNNNGLGDACDSEQTNISEAFTPNGDGINDTWVISNIENHPNSVVRVFNRWGAEVFVARNYQNNWDGHAKGNSSTLPAASSYYYQIDLDGDGTIDKQGWIYINR
jgi:gliding motility-associated-like protein